MDLRTYLPSSNFSTIVGSIGLAGGLILLAQYVTRPPSPTALLTASNTTQTQNWQSALFDVQADAPGLPSAPDESVIQSLREAAKSTNVTTSVARSLFVNLTEAGAQGLGSDLPTQEKLIADAANQLQAAPAVVYTTNDLTLVVQTSANTKLWGNGVIRTFQKYPRANNDDTLLAIGRATDTGDTAALAALGTISGAYAALAADLASLPVPSTLSPLYLQLINDLSRMSSGAREMQEVMSDPLRGLAGLQTFQIAGKEAARVLITLAEQLNKGGILFTKDEPGATWAAFTPLYTQ